MLDLPSDNTDGTYLTAISAPFLNGDASPCGSTVSRTHEPIIPKTQFLGWQAPDSFDEFSLLLQEWHQSRTAIRHIGGGDRPHAGTINVFAAATVIHESHFDPRHAVPAELFAARLRGDGTRRRRRSGRRSRDHPGEVKRQNVIGRKGFPDARSHRSLRRREDAGHALRRADRRSASRRTFLARPAAGSKHALRLSGSAGVRTGPLAAKRRHRAVRR
jgi:hypothetical protein